MFEGYRKLDVFNLAYQLSLDVHQMTLSLPKFEMYEEGSQIRRSSKSICGNIVEGYALRKYKNEFIHHLYRAYGSAEDTVFYLGELHDTGSLKDQVLFERLNHAYRNVNGKIFRFLQYVERNYEVPHYLNKDRS